MTPESALRTCLGRAPHMFADGAHELSIPVFFPCTPIVRQKLGFIVQVIMGVQREGAVF